MHGVVGRAIESTFAHDLSTHYGQLARHFRLAGDRERAILYSEQAAVQAEAQWAFAEAMSHRRTSERDGCGGLGGRTRAASACGWPTFSICPVVSNKPSSRSPKRWFSAIRLTTSTSSSRSRSSSDTRDSGRSPSRVSGGPERSSSATSQRSTGGRVSAALSIGLATCLVDLPGPTAADAARAHELIVEATDIARRLGDDELLGVGLGVHSALADAQPDAKLRLMVASEIAGIEGHHLPAVAVGSRCGMARAQLANGDAAHVDETIEAALRGAAASGLGGDLLVAEWARAGMALLRGQLDDASKWARRAYEVHTQRTQMWGAYESYGTLMAYVRRERGGVDRRATGLAYLNSTYPFGRKLGALFYLDDGDLDSVRDVLEIDPLSIPRALALALRGLPHR